MKSCRSVARNEQAGDDLQHEKQTNAHQRIDSKLKNIRPPQTATEHRKALFLGHLGRTKPTMPSVSRIRIDKKRRIAPLLLNVILRIGYIQMTRAVCERSFLPACSIRDLSAQVTVRLSAKFPGNLATVWRLGPANTENLNTSSGKLN